MPEIIGRLKMTTTRIPACKVICFCKLCSFNRSSHLLTREYALYCGLICIPVGCLLPSDIQQSFRWCVMSKWLKSARYSSQLLNSHWAVIWMHQCQFEGDMAKLICNNVWHNHRKWNITVCMIYKTYRTVQFVVSTYLSASVAFGTSRNFLTLVTLEWLGVWCIRLQKKYWNAPRHLFR